VTEHVARRRAYIGSLGIKDVTRFYYRIIAQLAKHAGGDPYGWDWVTMEQLGHGELLGAMKECLNRKNALDFPID
jgi:hypothetical protein